MTSHTKRLIECISLTFLTTSQAPFPLLGFKILGFLRVSPAHTLSMWPPLLQVHKHHVCAAGSMKKSTLLLCFSSAHILTILLTLMCGFSTHQEILRHQMGTLQFNSILTLSIWPQTLQVKGSVS